MNYTIKDPSFVRNGQKAMIMISDHIIRQKNMRRMFGPGEYAPTERTEDRWGGDSRGNSPRSPKFGSLEMRPPRAVKGTESPTLNIPVPNAADHVNA